MSQKKNSFSRNSPISKRNLVDSCYSEKNTKLSLKSFLLKWCEKPRHTSLVGLILSPEIEQQARWHKSKTWWVTDLCHASSSIIFIIFQFSHMCEWHLVISNLIKHIIQSVNHAKLCPLCKLSTVIICNVPYLLIIKWK